MKTKLGWNENDAELHKTIISTLDDPIYHNITKANSNIKNDKTFNGYKLISVATQKCKNLILF